MVGQKVKRGNCRQVVVGAFRAAVAPRRECAAAKAKKANHGGAANQVGGVGCVVGVRVVCPCAPRKGKARLWYGAGAGQVQERASIRLVPRQRTGYQSREERPQVPTPWEGRKVNAHQQNGRELATGGEPE